MASSFLAVTQPLEATLAAVETVCGCLSVLGCEVANLILGNAFFSGEREWYSSGVI